MTEIDVGGAEAAPERLVQPPTEGRLMVRDIWLLRLRALLTRRGQSP